MRKFASLLFPGSLGLLVARLRLSSLELRGTINDIRIIYFRNPEMVFSEQRIKKPLFFRAPFPTEETAHTLTGA